MIQRAEPELVTSGPYRFVRHPIYSGLLMATPGTALVDNLLGLIVTPGSYSAGVSRPTMMQNGCPAGSA
jgi:protein-S-isoprenylcysteine O-methyltransferase Ste14